MYLAFIIVNTFIFDTNCICLLLFDRIKTVFLYFEYFDLYNHSQASSTTYIETDYQNREYSDFWSS